MKKEKKKTKPQTDLKNRLTEKQLARFWSKIEKTDTCWVWKESKHDKYGRFKLRESNLLAHRVSYEINIGPIPEGLQIDHLCRNKKCVNPEHLEPVTCKENIMRGNGLAAKNASKDRCKCGRNFDCVYSGRRSCMECKRRIALKYYHTRGKFLKAAKRM